MGLVWKGRGPSYHVIGVKKYVAWDHMHKVDKTSSLEVDIFPEPITVIVLAGNNIEGVVALRIRCFYQRR